MPKRSDRRLIVPIFALLVLGAAFTLVYAVAVRAQSVNVSATVPGVCGNGIIEPGEECDGANLNGLTCNNLGFASGTLACSGSCAFDTSVCFGGGSSSGSGDPSTAPPDDTSVVLSGWGYTRGTVVVLEDGVIRTSVTADPSAEFQATINTGAGVRTFTVYGVDRHGRRSPEQAFTVVVNPNALTSVTGIFLPPTIDLESASFGRGETLNILGQTVPIARVSAYIDLQAPAAAVSAAGSDGAYRLPLRTDSLEYGEHSVHVRAFIAGGPSSGFSETLSFTVTAARPAACGGPGDLTSDCGVNMADLSVLLFWWNTDSPRGLAVADLNGDGLVNLVDLSILLFNWTD